MKSIRKNGKRALSLLLALAILCSFFSVFPLYRYPGHHCDETHCVLCTVVRAADALLHHTQALFEAALLLFVVCLLLFLRPLLMRRAAHAPDTPVSLKIKILG